MNFLVDNWYVILAAAALIVVVVLGVIAFIRMPREKQLEMVSQWLLYAVTKAEKELGSGTGSLKLRAVYDAFLVKFPWLAKIIDFATFSGMVDMALDEMRDMIDKNDAVKEYVEGER